MDRREDAHRIPPWFRSYLDDLHDVKNRMDGVEDSLSVATRLQQQNADELRRLAGKIADLDDLQNIMRFLNRAARWLLVGVAVLLLEKLSQIVAAGLHVSLGALGA